jgi:hypothetical protein
LGVASCCASIQLGFLWCRQSQQSLNTSSLSFISSHSLHVMDATPKVKKESNFIYCIYVSLFWPIFKVICITRNFFSKHSHEITTTHFVLNEILVSSLVQQTWIITQWIRICYISIHCIHIDIPAFPISHKLSVNLYKIHSMVWVRERTIPIERPPLVGELFANFCG